jgi:hypothetical protein
MIVVNLFAGPGAGKSTTASAVFTLFKRAYYNIELVGEYLVWEERHKMFGEQDYIFAQQNKRLRRLIGKVDIAVTDSPILLGCVYTPDNYYLPSLKSVVFEGFKSYNSVNYYIVRKKEYIGIGRNQTEGEAIEKDDEVKILLDANGIEYTTIDGDETAEHRIFEHLKPKLESMCIFPTKRK